MKTHQHTLKNGLRVLTIDTVAFPSVTTLLLVGAGSRYETAENNGIAHFFEHMAFKGSTKYPTSMELASTIDGLGGIFNAFTSKDHTGYWIKAPTMHFHTMVDVIADMIQHSKLDSEEIEREKGVIVEEINMYEDTPMRTVGELYEGLVYGGNPLGFDIAGSKKTVTSFTRKTFTDYMSSLYFPSNSLFVVAGGLSHNGGTLGHEGVESTIEKSFGDWKDGKAFHYDDITERQSTPGVILKTKKTEQAHFCLGFRAFGFGDPRRYALGVLSAILGGGMSSRLFYEIRERRGLCYYVSTSRDMYQDVGGMVTQAGVTIQKDKVKQAIEVALGEHKKIAAGEITEKELARAKELMKGRLVLSMEDSENVATFFGRKLLLQSQIEDLKSVFGHIDAVTAGDVTDLAKELFVNERLNFALIGPFENKAEFEDVVHM